jgi:DNA adenine methylase
MLPFLKWAGGKRWLWRRYPALFHARAVKSYVEPFLGGGAIFFALSPKKAVLSDLNRDLIATYQAVKTNWRDVLEKLNSHQKEHLIDANYYYEVRGGVPGNEIEAAARFIYLNRTCFNGLYRVNLNGIFNVPKGTKNSVVFPGENFEKISARLQSAKFIACDFEETIGNASPGDFLFLDPPYTVKHNENGFLNYNEKIFSWKDQERLAQCVRKFARRGGKALITNAAHPSVVELFSGLGSIIFTNRESVIASGVEHRSGIKEIAITVGYELEN